MRTPLKASIKRLKETLLLFLFLISNWFRVRGRISTAWKEKGNGKLLLSLKLQGVSFIMKVQRNGKCEAALFQYLCFRRSSHTASYMEQAIDDNKQSCSGSIPLSYPLW